MKKVLVVGSGVAGLAASIRLAHAGFSVKVLEKEATYGGKMGVLEKDGFRWDTGPSLFTMPQYVLELLAIDGKKDVDFSFHTLGTVCNYFWDDGISFSAVADKQKLIQSFEEVLGEPKQNVELFLNKSEEKYLITNHVFLEQSLHRFKTYLKWGTIKSMLQIHKVDIFKKMHHQTAAILKTPKAIQFFDRYATYNGSNPYQAPATLNVIPHYEIGFGAFLPKGGIRAIADALYQKALKLGVEFEFNFEVKDIKKIQGMYQVNIEKIADIVVSNMDIATASKGPLSSFLKPAKSQYEPSSSALIFYWGINKLFPQLNAHNIFFSNDYKNEFDHIFHQKSICDDPTVYVHITSGFEKNDAPDGSQNFFVMINVPHMSGQNWEALISKSRENILKKLSHSLQVNLSDHIVSEEMLTPEKIQTKTGSHLGALYGSSSNHIMSAFLRQPNFSFKHKGLYFCGGSVHPGGGIPLCLLSAKITTEKIKSDYGIY
jgi:phytoene desaturase